MFLLLVSVIGLCQVVSAAPLAKCLVDLTHTFDNNTMYYPTMEKFQMNVLYEGYIDTGDNHSVWLLLERYSSGIHVGTHMDAPLHFYQLGWALDDIPLNRLSAPAAVVDVKEKAAINNDYQVTTEDLLEWETVTGQKLNEVILLIRSGWSKRWHDRLLFTGSPNLESTPLSTAELHFPGLHPDAAQWLVDNRNIYGLGTECLSLDYGPERHFRTHTTLLSHNIFGMENIADMDELPLYGATLYVMPMKIGGASGAPLRIVATFPDVVFERVRCSNTD